MNLCNQDIEPLLELSWIKNLNSSVFKNVFNLFYSDRKSNFKDFNNYQSSLDQKYVTVN